MQAILYRLATWFGPVVQEATPEQQQSLVTVLICVLLVGLWFLYGIGKRIGLW